MAARYTTRPAWWVKWKSLRLPWRKKWLVGFDLEGNTFWEFKTQMHDQRLRRIVENNGHLANMADLRLTPAWMQWLRHMRQHPPSIVEQQADIQRQSQMIKLARQADERWDALAPVSNAPNAPSITSPNNPVVPVKSFSLPSKYAAATGPVTPQHPTSTVVSPSTTGQPSNTSTHSPVGGRQPRDHSISKDSGPQPDSWVPKSRKRSA